MIWTRTFGSPNQDYEWVSNVAVDGSGNAYVVGYTNGALGGVDGNGSDTFIQRYNANGSPGWTRQFDYSSIDDARAITFSGGNLYLVGTYLVDEANYDYSLRIIKFNTSGSEIYNSSYDSAKNQFPTDISVSGGVYISGYEYDGNNQDGFVMKFGTSGSSIPLWSKFQATAAEDITDAVLARTNSEVYGAGTTAGVLRGSNHGGYDAFLRRFSATYGNTFWTDQ